MDYFLDMPLEFSLYENASVVLLPVPYDGTSTFVKGADKGPQAIIDASDSIELYDIEEDTEIYLQGIHTAEPVREFSSPEAMADAVYRRVQRYLKDNKLTGLLGGEHSVSIGAIRATAEKYPDLTVLQLDAHADLRDEYQGSAYNHACVMRRAQTFASVVQVGIRSMCLEEKPNSIAQNLFYAHTVHHSATWMQDAIDRLGDTVYLTIDLDCFDPSVLPSTGTPLPGGLSWQQVLDFISEVNKHTTIVGFDVVELCPNPSDKSSDVLAAVLTYKLITKILKKTKQ
ncbi:MAG: agmatinase [Bacteroidales bacterium]|jgi:agmatinase|nr:agmatinase [Bacteroidales bacterium]